MRRTGFCLLLAALLLTVTPTPGQVPSHAPPPPRPVVLIVDASAALVDAVLFRRIDRTEPFCDVIKEVPNTGTRRTVGTVHGVLVPDATHGAVEIVFSGITFAEAVGKRPMTQTYTNTVTTVTSSYRVTFDARGLCGARAGAGAGASIRLLDVIDSYGERDSPPVDFVRRGFLRDKGELERIVSRRAAKRAALRQEAEIAEQLPNAGTTLGLAWARRLGLPIGTLEYETTTAHLEARLAAPVPTVAVTVPPRLAAGDFSVRVHETLLNDVARTGLGGRTFPFGELQAEAEKLLLPLLRDGRQEKVRLAGMQALAKLLRGLTGKPASVTFAADDPLRFHFSDQGVTVVARLAHIQLDDTALPGLRMQATYRIVNTQSGIALERQGALDVQPEPAAKKSDTLLQAAVRTAVSLVGAEIFRERLDVVALARPDGVTAARADAGRGWLSVTWQLSRGAAAGASGAATP